MMPNISISSRTSDSMVHLLCWLEQFSPKEIDVKWYEGNTLLSTGITFQISNNVRPFFAISQLSIDANKWNKGTEFKCEAKHMSNTVNQTWSICKANPNLTPLIRLEKPRLKSVISDSEVTVSCVIDTVLDVQVSWLGDGKEITGQVSNTRLERTTANLTINTDQWINMKEIACKVEHPCFDTTTKTIKITESTQKSSVNTPTVVIRRIVADTMQEDSVMLECSGRDLPSGELMVMFNASNSMLHEPQSVDLPNGVDTLTTRVTVPKKYHAKDQRFTCQIQQSKSTLWLSNSTGNIFDEPSVKLSIVRGANESRSTTQKLICSATGFYPKITWFMKSADQESVERTENADGRVKVSSEISVPLQKWNEGVTVTCQVSDQARLGNKSINVCAVTPAFAQDAQVYLLPPSISDTKDNKYFSVTGLLLGPMLTNFYITWRVGNNISSANVDTQPPIDHGNGTQSRRSVLKVPAAKWNKYIPVIFEVKHLCAKGSQKHSISKTKDLKSPIVRMISPSDDDLSGVNSTTLLCLIEGFRPADISVNWELNGKQLEASRFTNSLVGIRAASGDYSMHSALTLPASKKENGTFACVVSHESFKTPKSTTIHNIYASVTAHAPAVELLQGRDELVCLVYGYSPSAINITWVLNDAALRHDNTSSSAKGPDGKFSIQSHLKLQAMEWAPGDPCTCRVEHITGTTAQTIVKSEFNKDTMFVDENKSEDAADQAEDTWNMACAFIILFIISLLYGCSVTLIKVKTA